MAKRVDADLGSTWNPRQKLTELIYRRNAAKASMRFA